ncbi:MAG: hypothetical protein PHE24_05315 [Patescibacteria group bacterium]|nr:hypothetical protein [Patescibacteria group bacterium]
MFRLDSSMFTAFFFLIFFTFFSTGCQAQVFCPAQATFGELTIYLEKNFADLAREIPPNARVGKISAKSFLVWFSEQKVITKTALHVAEAIAKKDGLMKIYVVPQTHSRSGEWTKEGLESQKKVANFIRKKRIKLVIDESPFDPNISSFAKDNQFYSAIGIGPRKDSSQINKELANSKSWWGEFYRQKGVMIFGFDITEINFAGGILKSCVISGDLTAPRKAELAELYGNFCDSFRRFLAVAKAVDKMSATGIKESAIVMGNLHKDELLFIIKTFGIKAEIAAL